jgi:ribosomal-protein-alanine N-acetyltransferase
MSTTTTTTTTATISTRTDPIISTATHLVRPHTLQDLPSLTSSLNDHSITKWMTDRVPFPYTLESARGFYDYLQSQDPLTDYSIIDRESGNVVGGLGLKTTPTDIHRRTVELGYWLSSSTQGQGVMSTLVPLFLRWTFEIFPSDAVNRVEASVFSGNAGSMRVLQKCGFREEGVLRGKVWKEGKVLDLHIWGLLREEFEIEGGVENGEVEIGHRAE